MFLELLQAQISHGITSIRLIREEVRRARFFAALVKRKNDELHQLLEQRQASHYRRIVMLPLIVIACQQEELRTSELRFLRMSEISPLGIWSATPESVLIFCILPILSADCRACAISGEITFVNKAWWEITQHPKGANPSTFLESVHTEDLEKCQDTWRNAMTVPVPCKPVEFRWKGRNGQPDRWTWAIASPEVCTRKLCCFHFTLNCRFLGCSLIRTEIS